jgi:hypothetical protein
MNSVPPWHIAAPVGALLLGIGAYWLLKFDRMHRASAGPRRDRPAPPLRVGLTYQRVEDWDDGSSFRPIREATGTFLNTRPRFHGIGRTPGDGRRGLLVSTRLTDSRLMIQNAFCRCFREPVTDGESTD